MEKNGTNQEFLTSDICAQTEYCLAILHNVEDTVNCYKRDSVEETFATDLHVGLSESARANGGTFVERQRFAIIHPC